MKCASCGQDNPGGARFCVHCGTEQVSTPIAVAAAANAVRPRSPVPQAANAPQAASAPQAANAPQADASRTTGRQPRAERPRATRHFADAWGPDTQAPAFPAGSDPFEVTGGPYTGTPPRMSAPTPAAIPVYAAHPRRLGIAMLLVALCVIVALIAFVAWKTRVGAPAAPPPAAEISDDASVMSAFPPDATPQRPARAGAPPGRGSPQAASGGSGVDAPPTGGASTADGVAAHPPVEIKPLPAKPARKAAVATAPKSPPAPPVVQPEAAPAPAPPPVAAAPRKAAPAVDRWVLMAEELSRCTREDFISRVICDQRVRFRYCEGYWGKTPQCPGNPVPERGQ